MAARKEYSQEHKGKTTCLLKGFVLSYVEKKKKTQILHEEEGERSRSFIRGFWSFVLSLFRM